MELLLGSNTRVHKDPSIALVTSFPMVGYWDQEPFVLIALTFADFRCDFVSVQRLFKPHCSKKARAGSIRLGGSKFKGGPE